jgi:WD40 repeat protein
VRGCAVAPDSSYIVSASNDNTLRMWNPDTGDTIHTLKGPTDPVRGCAVAPDSSYIVSASDDNTLRIWK